MNQHEVIIDTGNIKSKIIVDIWKIDKFLNWLKDNDYVYIENKGIFKKQIYIYK